MRYDAGRLLAIPVLDRREVSVDWARRVRQIKLRIFNLYAAENYRAPRASNVSEMAKTLMLMVAQAFLVFARAAAPRPTRPSIITQIPAGSGASIGASAAV